MCQIFLIPIVFRGSDWLELDFLGFLISISLDFIRVFSKGTDDFKNLRRETMYIADYEYVNISSFAVSDLKLWLEEDGDLNTNHPLHSFKFIQSKAQN